MKDYTVKMEIEGPFAMWGRPDTGSTPTSYPVPTWSAAKGIFESIAFFNDGAAWINPVRVEVCRHTDSNQSSGGIRFQKYTTNYRGPLKEKKKGNFQLAALVVVNACYRLHGIVVNGVVRQPKNGNNPCHHLQDKFMKRLRNGRCFRTPFLGWSEFTPTYWGPCRTDDDSNPVKTEVDQEINLEIMSLLHHIFDQPISGYYQPEFKQGEASRIVKGVLTYD